MTALAGNLLTTAIVDSATELPDAVRLVRWSRKGRLLAVAADGSALVGHGGQITPPMTPDARDAAWVGEAALVIADPMAGLVTAGVDQLGPVPLLGAHRIGIHRGHTVVAGDGRVAVFDRGFCAEPHVIATGTGVTHACTHLGGVLWAIGGTRGLALVDVALGCVEEQIEIPGVVAMSSRGDLGRLVVSDLAGSIHVVELADPSAAVELCSHVDPVRHLSLSPDGVTIVCADDDELTMWGIGVDGSGAEEPLCVFSHEGTISALDQAENGFLATGDDQGVVHIWSPLLPGYPVATLHLEGEVTALAWDVSGNRLACGSVTGQLSVVETRAGCIA